MMFRSVTPYDEKARVFRRWFLRPVDSVAMSYWLVSDGVLPIATFGSQAMAELFVKAYPEMRLELTECYHEA